MKQRPPILPLGCAETSSERGGLEIRDYCSIYFPRVGEIANKTLFGSDWPSPGIPGMRVNAEAFLQLPLDEETKRMILYDNADQLLFQR